MEVSKFTLRIVDFAIGDVITSFPALYRLALEKSLAIWFENPQIRNLWAGPPVEMLSDPPIEGKSYDIRKAAELFSDSGLHMIQSWFWTLGLPVPEKIPNIPLAGGIAGSPEDAIDVIISPFSASDRAVGSGLKTWPFDRWNIVTDALLAAGFSVAVCGVFREGADPRSLDERFWGDRPIRVLDSLPLIELVAYLRSARCVATVDNGICHMAHILGVPHAQLIPVVTGTALSWIVDHSPRAAWIYEPFRAFPGRDDVLQPERVLELIFSVLSGFNREAYLAGHADLKEALENASRNSAWHHWVLHGQNEGRRLGHTPRPINHGALWKKN